MDMKDAGGGVDGDGDGVNAKVDDGVHEGADDCSSKSFRVT